jgi:hypothetical protein
MQLRHLRSGAFVITPVGHPDIEVDGNHTFEVDDPTLARSLLEQPDNYGPADDESQAVADELAALREAHDEVAGADPDDLTVAQLLPTLDALNADELRDLRARETAGKARKSVLNRIDELLAPAGDEQEA